MIYPWQKQLSSELSKSPLAPVLLLAGRPGIGKLHFARELAKRALCEKETACGNCDSCRRWERGAHPDYRELEPDSEEGSGRPGIAIKVEQVRAIREASVFASAGARVTVVHPAEAMNANSQNALLKVLEEPPPRLTFILVSHHPQALLPTLVSRCCRVTMPPPNSAEAAAWLKEQGVAGAEQALALAAGAPLLALDLAEQQEARKMFVKYLSESQNAFALASNLQRFAPATVVHWLQQWTYDLMLYQAQGKIRYHIDDEPRIAREAGRIAPKALIRLQRELLAAAGLVEHTLRAELFIEQLSISYWRSHG